MSAARRSHVRFEQRGHVGYVTLNRPEVLNAMDLGMHEELGCIWNDIDANDDIRVVVLTGEGDRAFSVGQDLRERARLNESGVKPTTFGSRGQPGWPRLTERFGFSKPVVARVNGYALGGGFELALACDIIVAADNAVFALPEALFGLIPGAGGVFRLPRQLPLKIAMGCLLTGRHLSAKVAADLGLVNDVVPADELDQCVGGWVEDLLRAAPLAVRAIKEAAMGSLSMSLEQAFATRFEREQQRMCSRDAVEGPRAFAENRQPIWYGR